MSILIRSQVSEDPKLRMNEEELLSQMSTLILAGHETTAASLAWLLYELAKHPEDQIKIRAEVSALRRAKSAHELTEADFNALPMLNAAIKESMRLHPILHTLAREALRDDIIPLAFPVTTQSGDTTSEVYVAKGQTVLISICAYNRLPEVWGNDAEEWNLQRFLDPDLKERQTTLGVYSNLLNFSGGIRGCIGWRFALMEMQSIAVELLSQFNFAVAPDVKIQRVPTGIMMPMKKGKMEEGVQLPLEITTIDN